MTRRTPRSTRTDARVPYTTLFRSATASMLTSQASCGVATIFGWLQKTWPRGSGSVAKTSSEAPESWPDSSAASRSASTRSEEHTSELQSLMRISYAVFCLKNKHKQQNNHPHKNKIHQHTSTH